MHNPGDFCTACKRAALRNVYLGQQTWLAHSAWELASHYCKQLTQPELLTKLNELYKLSFECAQGQISVSNNFKAIPGCLPITKSSRSTGTTILSAVPRKESSERNFCSGHSRPVDVGPLALMYTDRFGLEHCPCFLIVQAKHIG